MTFEATINESGARCSSNDDSEGVHVIEGIK